jgi:NADP-dependent 3-hydroxy acid dehydrogenase YdfG
MSLICARHGAKLLLAARRVEQLNSLSARCISAGASEVNVFRVDVSNEADCKAMVDQAIDKFGAIDLLVLNAGVGQVNVSYSQKSLKM